MVLPFDEGLPSHPKKESPEKSGDINKTVLYFVELCRTIPDPVPGALPDLLYHKL